MTGQPNDPKLFFSEMLTIKKTELLRGSKPVAIWTMGQRWLAQIHDATSIPESDILSEAMRDGFAECKTKSGCERMRAYYRKYKDAKDVTGKSVPTNVDWADAEMEELKKLYKDQQFPEVAFTTWCVEKYYQDWVVRHSRSAPARLRRVEDSDDSE
jgi:hypothetical protein